MVKFIDFEVRKFLHE